MGKEDLRSGLEGWIRNTREVAHDLVTPVPPDSETPSPRATDAGSEPPSAAALVTALHSQVRAIAAKARLLESFEPQAEHDAKAALARDLVDLARTLAPQVTQAEQHPTPEPAPDEGIAALRPAQNEDSASTTRVHPIPADAFHHDVLEAEVPVLVELHLEGYRPCEKVRQALEKVAELYDGPVDVRTLNVMEAEPQILPQIVKVGRDFFDRNLPKVLLYVHGAKVGEVSGEVSAEDLVELLRSEVEA